MKKVIFLALATVILAGPAAREAQGQGFLRRLGDRVAGKVADAVLGSEEEQQAQQAEQQQRSEERAQAAMGALGLGNLGSQGAMGGMTGMGAMGTDPSSQGVPERINPTALAKSRLAATASWDDVVTPSSASTLDGLIRELPALPTVADLVNPDAEKRAAYYRKIAAVNLRVEQLSQQAACSDGELDAFTDKVYAEQAARFGLTAAELRSLDSGTLSAAEEAALQQRIMEAVLGGGNLGGIMAMAADAEAMTGPDGELTQEQAMALLSKHGASLNLGGMMAATQEYTAQMQRQSELYRRMTAIGEKMSAVTAATPVARYGDIARKYDSDLGGMYNQLCAANDPATVDAIYSRADALVKNYRREAATAWLAELQQRMQNLAAAYPDMLALEADMVAEGLMAPCSQRVSSLNIVSRFANILDGAYRDFPQTEMLPVCREVILSLPENETLFTSESAMATTVEGFLDGSEIMVYDRNTGQNYVYENGRKRPLAPNEPGDFAALRERPKPTYGHWTSANGMRSVDYQQDGALMLHDGTIFYPLAFQVEGNIVTWISQTGNRLEKCVYKL